MLLHLFEMQDRNSAWNDSSLWSSSLVLKHRPEENRDSRHVVPTLQSFGSSPIHHGTGTSSQAAANLKHKHSELDALCGSQNFPDRHRSSVSHSCLSQPTSNRRAEATQVEDACQQNINRAIALINQTTKSEPTTRSNSADCEKDATGTSLGSRSSNIEACKTPPDLTIPDRKLA